MKRMFGILVILFISTGCTVKYNLDISSNGFKENIIISANDISENDLINDFPVGAYKMSIENENNPMKKIEGQEYYNSEISVNKNGLKSIKYNYLFSQDDFHNANSIYTTSFENFVMRKYDHNNDGKNDYMLISTSDDFSWFENNKELEKVQINITCHYEVISSNADKVNKNIYTWNLDRNNIKPINMVYNPDKVIDYRTIWEKILDGDYFTPFTISLIILIIGFIAYKIFKRHSDKVDEI